MAELAAPERGSSDVLEEGRWGVCGLDAPPFLLGNEGEETRWRWGEWSDWIGDVRPEWIEALAPVAVVVVLTAAGERRAEAGLAVVLLLLPLRVGVGGGEGAITARLLAREGPTF